MASRASAVTQQWVDQQVDAAKNDNEPGLYSRTQAARQPRALYLRWKRLNSVMGAETSDTWMAAIGWGLAVAVPVLVLLAWAAWGRWMARGAGIRNPAWRRGRRAHCVRQMDSHGVPGDVHRGHHRGISFRIVGDKRNHRRGGLPAAKVAFLPSSRTPGGKRGADRFQGQKSG